MSAKIQFLPHAVAYLDILGFSRFVEEAETNQSKRNSLEKLFHEVIPREIFLEGKNSAYPRDLELRCLSYSDSIVISSPVFDQSSYPALIAVSIKTIQVAHALLDMEFLVRGAIAVGNVHRTKSNILGTGFQEAVKGEKTDNPQIFLTKSAEKALNELMEKGYWRYSIYAKNAQGQIILNSIHPETSYLPDANGKIGDYFRKYRETILNNLSNDDLKVRQKWLWFAGLFNENLKTLSSLIGQDARSMLIDEKLLAITLNYLNPPESDQDWMNPFKAPGFSVRINPELIPKE